VSPQHLWVNFHPRRTTHLTTPFPSPAPTSNIPLLPLPWTSARYIPKMSMDSGVEHVTAMATSSIIVNVTQPNLNTSFTKCALTTLMLGSYKKHSWKKTILTLILADITYSDITHRLTRLVAIISSVVSQLFSPLDITWHGEQQDHHHRSRRHPLVNLRADSSALI